MRFEIENGNFLATAEWTGPGDVVLDMPECAEKRWLERYFAAEAVYLAGPVDCPEMVVERRDATEAAFTHAAYELGAWDCTVRVAESAGVGSNGGGARK
jgi:hypothetical protein